MLTDLPEMTDGQAEDDPLGAHWVEDFFKVRRRRPTDADRQDRLFSLIIYGGGPGNSWTDADWAIYETNRKALWQGRERWPAENNAEGYDCFQTHLERLAGHYSNNHDDVARFSRAAGLVWGGIAYQGSAFKALARASVGHHQLQLHEGVAGWQSRHLDDLNPAHHWVAAFLTGFCYGTVIGAAINTIRDIAQYVTGQGGSRGDIVLGNIAALHGHLLAHDFSNGPDPYVRLFSRMRQDLVINNNSDDGLAVTLE
jgi:hypothetical protein